MISKPIGKSIPHPCTLKIFEGFLITDICKGDMFDIGIKVCLSHCISWFGCILDKRLLIEWNMSYIWYRFDQHELMRCDPSDSSNRCIVFTLMMQNIDRDGRMIRSSRDIISINQMKRNI